MLTLMTILTDQLKRKENLRKTKSDSNKIAILSQEFFLMANVQTCGRVSAKNSKGCYHFTQMLETNFT